MINLPTPSLEAIEHSDKLKQTIAHHIEHHQGFLSFAEFMQNALYEPALGYYVAGSQKFGREGDFVTAPEISPLFSQTLAKQCQEVLANIEHGSILELGAGMGTMAADILLQMEADKALPEQYFILEVSPDLQEKQLQTLQTKAPHLLTRVKWLAQLPQGFKGIIIGNEVLDAMPVHIFQLQATQVNEKGIKFEGDNFVFDYQAANPFLTEAVAHIIPNDIRKQYPEGYESEINLALPNFIEQLSHCLAQGVMLFIDYGYPKSEYYLPQRSQGTLMCHYRHHTHPDPLQYLGLQDITAHVNFTQVAEAAVEHDLQILGYTNQASFLLGGGMLNISPAANKANTLSVIPDSLGTAGDRRSSGISSTKDTFTHNQAIKKLTMPNEMGELFKVIALGKGVESTLSGFQLLDLSHRL